MCKWQWGRGRVGCPVVQPRSLAASPSPAVPMEGRVTIVKFLVSGIFHSPRAALHPVGIFFLLLNQNRPWQVSLLAVTQIRQQREEARGCWAVGTSVKARLTSLGDQLPLPAPHPPPPQACTALAGCWGYSWGQQRAPGLCGSPVVPAPPRLSGGREAAQAPLQDWPRGPAWCVGGGGSEPDFLTPPESPQPATT